MSNIEAPKALSQFRAWGIARGDQIAVEESAESAAQFSSWFSIHNALVVEVNRAFSAVLRGFYPCILGRCPRLAVDRCAFGADHRLKAWLPAQVVSAPSVGYCSKLKLKNFCA